MPSLRPWLRENLRSADLVRCGLVFHARNISLNPRFSHTAQNLAREFGPQGVHVSHVMVDGEVVASSELDSTYLSSLEMNACRADRYRTSPRHDGLGRCRFCALISTTVTCFDLIADGAEKKRSQRIDPNAIAETFLNLAQQPRSCWTHGEHSTYSLCVYLGLPIVP